MDNNIRLVTHRTDIPEYSWLLEDGFHLLNMWTEGIWLVDQNHEKFLECVQTAINIARTMGDRDHVIKYTELLKIKDNATEKNH